MTFTVPSTRQEPPPDLPVAISRLAVAGGVIVALLVPLIVLLVGYQSEASRLETALQVTVRNLAPQSPHSPLRIAGVTGDGARALAVVLAAQSEDANLRIFDSDRRILVDKPRDVRLPLIVRTAILYPAEQTTWRLELSRSLWPLLLYGLYMIPFGFLLGWLTFVALKDVPMRAFRMALQEIAVRKTAEEQLAKSLSIFSATLESTADGILVTDAQGRAVVSNQRFLDLWSLAGTRVDDSETLPSLASQLRDPVAFLNTQKDLTRRIDVDHGTTLELRDGRLFEWNSRPQYVDGSAVGRVSSFRDISERKRAEALLVAEKEVLEMVVCGLPLKAALCVLARHVEVLSGQMFCTILFRENENDDNIDCASGPSLQNVSAVGIVQEGQSAMRSIFADFRVREELHLHGVSDEFSGVIENIDVSPEWQGYRQLTAEQGIKACFAVSIHASTGQLLGVIVAHYRHLTDQPPHDRELVWVAAHMTSIAIERRQAETRLRILAHYDGLTLLPNRDLFRDRLSQALAHAERHKTQLAVMFLDLDRFKTINDTLGHDSGDVLLREVSARLRLCVREEDTVARLGGDEFTVILEQIGAPEDAALVAEKIVEVLTPSILLGGQEAFVTPSIGITIYPADGDNLENLLKNADTAMYRAKEEGGNGFRFFTREMNALAAGRLELESGLRRAIEREEFVVYYQPKFSLASEAITGAEALLRWQHPDKGMVSPAEFIPILEETGLIEQVGAWVLATVCRQMRAWQDAGVPPLTVAVNLSGRQLQRNNLAATIGTILEETGLNPALLELEVTESMLMHDPICAVDMLHQIRTKGVMHIDVDDFGTGYSSLSYLKRFPIDALKLDKSFVDGLPYDEDDIAISRAVIAMAHSLKLSVIAEGVENEAQLAFLRANGCDVIQGYLLSRPLPAAAFVQLVQDRQPPPRLSVSRMAGNCQQLTPLLN